MTPNILTPGVELSCFSAWVWPWWSSLTFLPFWPHAAVAAFAALSLPFVVHFRPSLEFSLLWDCSLTLPAGDPKRSKMLVLTVQNPLFWGLIAILEWLFGSPLPELFALFWHLPWPFSLTNLPDPASKYSQLYRVCKVPTNLYEILKSAREYDL